MSTSRLRLVDAGLVPPVRSQTVYHAVAHLMDDDTPDTVILVSPSAPYVSVGFHQDAEKEVDTAYCREHGLLVVRREVGGGAVYLDQNQLFVQWIVRAGRLPAKLEKRFELYVRPLIATYHDLGIDAYFRPVNDVHVGGKKICGTGAAAIGQAEVLVGSFMFDFDKAAMARMLKVPSEKMRDKIVESLDQYMTTMADLLPETPTREELIEHYVGHCEEALDARLVPGELTQAELAGAAKLDTLFTSPEWLHQPGGVSRPHVKIHEDVHVAEAAHKAPGGLIRVTARVRAGVLDDVELTGDFTILPASGVRALEEAFVGRALDREALAPTAAAVYADRHLEAPGVTPADIAEALLALPAAF